jgi:hypothetical protein
MPEMFTTHAGAAGARVAAGGASIRAYRLGVLESIRRIFCRYSLPRWQWRPDQSRALSDTVQAKDFELVGDRALPASEASALIGSQLRRYGSLPESAASLAPRSAVY